MHQRMALASEPRARTVSSATALCASADDGNYRTFAGGRPPPPDLDLNGDKVIDGWDEVAKQAGLCKAYAAAAGRAAMRFTNVDWAIICTQLVLNALTALFGAGSAMGNPVVGTAGGSGMATAGLAVAASVLVGLQRGLQPADKASECRHAQRALLTLGVHAETVSVFTQPENRPPDSRKYIDDMLDEMARILEPPVVSDAVARFGPRDCD